MGRKFIEKQVCTIEQAEKLRYLGFVQESLFWHFKNEYGENDIFNHKHIGIPNIENIFSAYTQTELLAFLPYGIGFQDNNITQIADYIIDLIEVEEFLVEEYNERYREFFEIDLTPHEL